MLAPIVLLVHLWLAGHLMPQDRFGFGAADTAPAKIEVAFVRELAPEAPPAAPPPRRAPPRRAVPKAAAAAASAASAAAAMPPDVAAAAVPPLAASAGAPAVAEAALEAAATEPAIPAPDVAPPLAALPVAPAASAATPFEWPPSTRLSYTLTGNYQGPVEGQASVEWLATGTHYQVHLEVSIGPPFAPLVARRISSDGAITADGLSPRRYDEETRVVLREPRRLTIRLDDDFIRLPGGATLVRPPGVQDSASQFVQMTWLFTMRPELLRSGTAIEFPLALPRRLDPWVYDVIGSEWLVTPLGGFETVHVRPRHISARRPDLTAEFWVAPTLQNLPIRIQIRQDEQTFVDLLLERLPQQAQR